MSLKPVIYMIMEIKAREFEGRTLVALEAASRGFRVVLGKKAHIKKGILTGVLPSGLYYEKSLTKGKEKSLQKFIDKGCILASQDEEGGFLDPSYDEFLSFRSSKESVGLTTSVFCWGFHDHEAWLRAYPDSIEKMHITGSPRVDFWRPEFHQFFKHQIESIKSRYGNFVLISSNFALANNYKSDKMLVLQGKQNGSIKTKEDENSFYRKISDYKIMFHKFVAAINNLSVKYPDINFVVRPHPAERMSAWSRHLSKRSNIHVVFEGGISPWVRSALAVLHNGCTTGIEAYVTGVPAIAYVPFDSAVNRYIPNKLSIMCSREDEIGDVFNRIIAGHSVNKHRTPHNDSIATERMVNVSGKPAVKRIVDVFELLDIPLTPPIKTTHSYGDKDKSLYQLSLKVFREILMKAKLFSNSLPFHFFSLNNRSLRKFPSLNFKEIQEIQCNLSFLSPKYMDCNIEKVYGDVFLLEME